MMISLNSTIIISVKTNAAMLRYVVTKMMIRYHTQRLIAAQLMMPMKVLLR